MGLIYMRISPSGGKYIGKTIGSENKRWQGHISEAYNEHGEGYNSILNKAIRKYGGNNFTCKILENNVPNEILSLREIYWIDYYKTFYLDNPSGYNMTKGGDSPIRVNEKNFLNLWNEGKSLTEISKITHSLPKTISKHLKILGVSEKLIRERGIEKQKEKQKKRKILQYSLNGTLINEFESGYSAAKALNFDCSAIHKACKSSIHKYQNYFWCYKDEEIDIASLINQKGICRKIKCIEDDKIFYSAKATADFYGIDHHMVIKSCKSLKVVRKINKHFIFYIEGENND